MADSEATQPVDSAAHGNDKTNATNPEPQLPQNAEESLPNHTGQMNQDEQISMNGLIDTQTYDANSMMNGYVQDPSQMYAMGTAMDPMQQNMLAMPQMQGISADEIALYDRQIRLWGVQAQEKIRNANILLIGMKGLGNEIAKNLVLAGVGTLTILDHEQVTQDDLGSQFLVSEQQVGQNRAEAAQQELQKLNPRVSLYVDPDMAATKLPEYFSSFDITIATGLPFDTFSAINMSCRMFNRRFYAAETHGMYGFVFADLIIHDYVVEKERGNIVTKPGDVENSTRSVISVSIKKENNKTIEMVTKQEMYSPLILANSSPLPADSSKARRSKLRVTPLLSCLRALFDFQRETGRIPAHNRVDLELFTRLANEKHLELQLPIETLRAEFLRSFIQNLGSEIGPVVAYLGGYLAQDVINVLGQREQPLQNFLLFDGEEFKGPTYSMHPIFDDSLNTQMAANGSENMNAMPAMNGTVATA